MELPVSDQELLGLLEEIVFLKNQLALIIL